MTIPNGIEHLSGILRSNTVTQRITERQLPEYTAELQLIGTSLSAIYQAATCHRECHGGGHVLESLAGRTYNLGIAAYILVRAGCYDEALNLIRSIGEICNLIQLSAADHDAIQQWLSSDARVRMREFTPAKVRAKLAAKGEVIYGDGDWYSELCEKYTHVNPSTRPNMHNEGGRAAVGGMFQPKGLEDSLIELASVLVLVGQMICRYFKFDDLIQLLDLDFKPFLVKHKGKTT